MKNILKLSIVLLFILSANFSSADMVKLLSGEVIDCDIIFRNDMFLRVRCQEGLPRREFLIENIERIEEDGKEIVFNEPEMVNKKVDFSDYNKSTVPDFNEVSVGEVFDRVLQKSEENKKKRKGQVITIKGEPQKQRHTMPSEFKLTSRGGRQSNIAFDATGLIREKGPVVFFSVVSAVALAIYVIFCLPLFLISKKTGTPHSFFAWIPLLQLYLFCRVAKMSGWFMILFFVPIINIIFSVFLWCKITEILKRPIWLGLLTIIPVINLIYAYYLAFAKVAAKEETKVDESKKVDKPSEEGSEAKEKEEDQQNQNIINKESLKNRSRF